MSQLDPTTTYRIRQIEPEGPITDVSGSQAPEIALRRANLFGKPHGVWADKACSDEPVVTVEPTVTDADIEAAQADWHTVGEFALVDLCDQALAGKLLARERIVKQILKDREG